MRAKRKFGWPALALVVLLAALMLLIATTAFAAPEEGSAPDRQKRDPAKAAERIDKAIARIKEMKEKRQAAFEKISGRLEKIVQKLEENGADVAKLKTDMAALKLEVQALAARSDELVSMLEAAKKLATPDTVKEFREAMKAAMAEGRSLKADAKKLKGFVKQVIRQDLKDLKGKVKRRGGAQDGSQGLQTEPAPTI